MPLPEKGRPNGRESDCCLNGLFAPSQAGSFSPGFALPQNEILDLGDLFIYIAHVIIVNSILLI